MAYNLKVRFCVGENLYWVLTENLTWKWWITSNKENRNYKRELLRFKRCFELFLSCINSTSIFHFNDSIHGCSMLWTSSHSLQHSFTPFTHFPNRFPPMHLQIFSFNPPFVIMSIMIMITIILGLDSTDKQKYVKFDFDLGSTWYSLFFSVIDIILFFFVAK
jgi:hypothetical protein